MAINYPVNRKEVADRIKTDIQNLLPDLEPFLRDSYISALATADAGRMYDLYVAIRALEKEMFPDTSTGSFLERWGSYKNITRNQATQSLGRISLSGVAGTFIPANTPLQSSDGLSFITMENKTIVSQTIIIVSIIRSGSVATVTTTSEHHFANGNNVTISGADQAEYNITASVTATSATTFTYLVSGNPVTPATTSSTLQATLVFANILVNAIDYGEVTNLLSGSELFLTFPISGANSSGVVQYEGLLGGTDEESDDALRTRILYSYQHPVAYFNVSELTALALTINYVTRVFIREITPSAGQVTIYFVCDKQTNIIPSGDQINEVKTKLLTIKPAHVDPADMIVNAPVAKVINFQFIAIEPDTQAMRDAIAINLEAMFAEIPTVGVNLAKYSYQSAIYQTIDTTTGQQLINYSLSTPTNDILVNLNELPILGTINFA